MTRAQDRANRQAFVRFDRLTAYGCAKRGVYYDQDACRLAWGQYQQVTGQSFPSPFTESVR